MRIAIIAEVFLPKIDGVVHRTTQLVRQLVNFGDDVLVVCPEAGGCNGCPAPVIEIPSFAFPLYPEYRIGLPDESLLQAVDRFAPDVIHFVNPFAFGFRCYQVLQRAATRIPTVFSFHTLYGEFVKQYRALRPLSALLWWLMRSYHNRADVNITVSSIMQEELIRRRFKRVRFWPPAVDADLFHPRAFCPKMRARLAKHHTDKKLLLTVSRLAPEKNVEFLAEVLRQLPDACLAIVGDGPHRARLEQRFTGLNANFMGYLTGADLAAAFASADAFVYASETETMGNVVLEAMASGCAIVAPRAGGIPSLVTHGESGMLFSPGNIAEAADYAKLVLSDLKSRRELGQAARQWVDGRDWSSSIAHIRSIYAEAINERKFIALPAYTNRLLARTVLDGLVHMFRWMAKEAPMQPLPQATADPA